MALTFTTTARQIGPGMKVTIAIPAGPIPLDDYVEVVVVIPFGSTFLIRGRLTTNGFLTVPVVLGAVDGGVIGEPIEWRQTLGGNVNLTATQYHADGTVVDTGAGGAGWTWDGEGTVYILVGMAASRTFPAA